MLSTIKSLLKLGVWTCLTLILGALITKIIAMTAGPSGVGYFSIFRQLQQTFVSLATLNGETALVQGISSRDQSEKNTYAFNVAKIVALFIAIVCIVSIVLLYFNGNVLAKKINVNQVTFLYMLLIPSTFASINVYFIGVLNGYGKNKNTVKAQTFSGFCGLVAVIFYFNKMDESSYVAVLSAMTIGNFIFCLFHISSLSGFNKIVFKSPYEIFKRDSKHFLSISFFAVLVGFAGAASLLLIRVKLTEYLGIKAAGIFDAAWTLSAMYLVLFLSSFGTYFMPKLSSLSDDKEFYKKLNELMYLSLFVSIFLILPAILLKPVLFKLFYSENFDGSISIFRWMVIGDYFKISAWVLSIPMLARAYMRPYFLFSLCWNMVFILTSYAFISMGGVIEYIGLAYLLTNIVYVFLSVIYWHRYRGLKFTVSLIKLWFAGLFTVILYSVLYWKVTSIDLMSCLILIVFILVYIYVGVGKEGRLSLFKIILSK